MCSLLNLVTPSHHASASVGRIKPRPTVEGALTAVQQALHQHWQLPRRLGATDFLLPLVWSSRACICVCACICMSITECH